jgi:hypothetical protein
LLTSGIQCSKAIPVVCGMPLSKRVVGYIGMKNSFVVADLNTSITVSFISSRLPPRAMDWARKRRLARTVYDDPSLPLGIAL